MLRGPIDPEEHDAYVELFGQVLETADAVAPEEGERLLVGTYNALTANLGWLYLLAGLAVLILLAWLAFGRYGQVRLASSEDEQPEFSTLSWTAMLFCAGVGAGLLIGFLWEWVREHRIRADSRAKSREVDALRREVEDLRGSRAEGSDDVLALLDGPGR